MKHVTIDVQGNLYVGTHTFDINLFYFILEVGT